MRLFALLPNLNDLHSQDSEANGAKNDLEHFPALLFGIPRGDRICHTCDWLRVEPSHRDPPCLLAATIPESPNVFWTLRHCALFLIRIVTVLRHERGDFRLPAGP